MWIKVQIRCIKAEPWFSWFWPWLSWFGGLPWLMHQGNPCNQVNQVSNHVHQGRTLIFWQKQNYTSRLATTNITSQTAWSLTTSCTETLENHIQTIGKKKTFYHDHLMETWTMSVLPLCTQQKARISIHADAMLSCKEVGLERFKKAKGKSLNIEDEDFDYLYTAINQ